jgi:hypothetical protein
MTRKKIDVLILSTVEGHASIAQSVEEALAVEKLSSKTYSFADPVLFLYRPLYRFAPWLGGIFFRILYLFPFIRNVARKYMGATHKETFEQTLSEVEPKVIVTASCGYDWCIDKTETYKKIPYISLITDPRDFFSYNLSQCALTNCVFDEHQQKRCQKYDHKAKTMVTGWFVRQKYEQPYDQKKVRAQLGLKQDQLTILIASGSEGSNIISSIFPSFFSITTPIQVIVACGGNTALLQHVKAFVQVLNKTKSKVTVLPIGFTSDLHLYMQASDLVMGKAGPNTLFESVATLTPFFAITHFSGQESGNLDIIRKYRLGYVEENPFKATTLLKHIIKNPEELKQFDQPLRKIAQYNLKHKQQFAQFVHQLAS